MSNLKLLLVKLLFFLTLLNTPFSLYAQNNSLRLFATTEYLNYTQANTSNITKKFSGILFSPTVDFRLFHFDDSNINLSGFYSKSINNKLKKYGASLYYEFFLNNKNSSYMASLSLSVQYHSTKLENIGYQLLSPGIYFTHYISRGSKTYSQIKLHYTVIGKNFSLENYKTGVDIIFPLFREFPLSLNTGFSFSKYNDPTNTYKSFSEQTVIFGIGFNL